MMVDKDSSTVSLFDTMVKQSFRRCVSSGDKDVLSTPVKFFKSYFYDIGFGCVLNSSTYDRCYGNFTNLVCNMVFAPGLVTGDIDMYRMALTREQVHDVLHTIFMLVVEDGLLTNGFIDYYERTPAMVVVALYSDDMPGHLKEFVGVFRRLFSLGKGIVSLQETWVARWLSRVRRKRAAIKIEDVWLRVANDPVTVLGKRVLERRVENWLLEDVDCFHVFD